MVEYFSTTRWDGAVDLSWYNGTDTEFTLTTPAQLAGVAELVNSNTTDFAGKTIRLGADISLLRYEETGKPGEPFQPTQPEKPTTPDTPATGDSSNVTALWVVLAVAGVGIIVLVVLRIRRTKLHREKALRPVWAAGLSYPRLCRRGGDFAPPEPFSYCASAADMV